MRPQTLHLFLPDFLCSDLPADLIDKTLYRHDAFIARKPASDGYRAAFRLILSDNEHIGKLRESCLADFEPDLFGAVIHRNIHAVFCQLFSDLFRILFVFFGNREDTHLFRA